MKKYSIKTYTKIHKNLRRDWDTLWNASSLAESTNSPEWVDQQIKKNAIKKLKIVTVYEGNDLIALIPLENTYHVGIESWVSVGRKISQKSTALFASQNKNIFREIAHFIHTENNNVVIDKIPELYSDLLREYLKDAATEVTSFPTDSKQVRRGRKRNVRPALLYTTSPTTRWWWKKARNMHWLTL
jgi:hypothetical protein